MKNIISILLLLSALGIAGNGYCQKKSKGGNSKKEYNEKDEFGRMQGTWQYFNGDGGIISEVEYKNDKREGLTKFYFPIRGEDSKIREEIQYLDGKRDGDFKRYFMTGETNMEGSYENGKKDLKWTKYFEDGTVKWEGNYKKGLKDGEWKFNDRKGNPLPSITYKDGVDLKAQAEAEKAAAEKKAAEKKALEKNTKPAVKPATTTSAPEKK